MAAELMKGHVWHERKNARDRKGNPIVKYPVRAEVKYDEIRCHVKVDHRGVEFLSYSGKPLANMQGFVRLWREISDYTGYTEFDCGFECNGNFNDSYRWVRSTTGIPDDLKGARIKFYLFDLPSIGNIHYVNRLPEIEWVCNLPMSAGYVWPCEGWVCDTEEEVDEHFYRVRAAGMEGLMIKSLTGLYLPGKRTDAWLKMKPENDADGVIIELIEAVCGKDQPEKFLSVGDKLGRVGAVLVRCADGSTAAPHGIPHDLGADMLRNPENYLGKWCEFNYMERDRQGGYRHPTFYRIREDK